MPVVPDETETKPLSFKRRSPAGKKGYIDGFHQAIIIVAAGYNNGMGIFDVKEKLE